MVLTTTTLNVLSPVPPTQMPFVCTSHSAVNLWSLIVQTRRYRKRAHIQSCRPRRRSRHNFLRTTDGVVNDTMIPWRKCWIYHSRASPSGPTDLLIALVIAGASLICGVYRWDRSPPFVFFLYFFVCFKIYCVYIYIFVRSVCSFFACFVFISVRKKRPSVDPRPRPILLMFVFLLLFFFFLALGVGMYHVCMHALCIMCVSLHFWSWSRGCTSVPLIGKLYFCFKVAAKNDPGYSSTSSSHFSPSSLWLLSLVFNRPVCNWHINSPSRAVATITSSKWLLSVLSCLPLDNLQTRTWLVVTKDNDCTLGTIVVTRSPRRKVMKLLREPIRQSIPPTEVWNRRHPEKTCHLLVVRQSREGQMNVMMR